MRCTMTIVFPVGSSPIHPSPFSCPTAGDNLSLLSLISLVPAPMGGMFAFLAIFLHLNIPDQTLDPDRILVVRK